MIEASSSKMPALFGEAPRPATYMPEASIACTVSVTTSSAAAPALSRSRPASTRPRMWPSSNV